MDYSYHLMMLQERNRLLKKLNLREDKETELRKKEKGFSLYLNGANTAPPPPPSHRQLQHRPSDLRDMRYMKTAGTYWLTSHTSSVYMMVILYIAGGSGRLSPDRYVRSHDDHVTYVVGVVYTERRDQGQLQLVRGRNGVMIQWWLGHRMETLSL